MTAEEAVKNMLVMNAQMVNSADRDEARAFGKMARTYAEIARTLLLVEHNAMMRESIAIAEDQRAEFLKRCEEERI